MQNDNFHKFDMHPMLRKIDKECKIDRQFKIERLPTIDKSNKIQKLLKLTSQQKYNQHNINKFLLLQIFCIVKRSAEYWQLPQDWQFEKNKKYLKLAACVIKPCFKVGKIIKSWEQWNSSAVEAY